MGITRATAIVTAIERDIEANPESPERAELTHTLYWLRHRIALREAAKARAESE